jgi:hypothetical protein
MLLMLLLLSRRRFGEPDRLEEGATGRTQPFASLLTAEVKEAQKTGEAASEGGEQEPTKKPAAGVDNPPALIEEGCVKRSADARS